MTDEKTEGHHHQVPTVTIEVPVFIRDALRRLSEETGNTEADILAPCALGGVLHARSIETLRVRVICGAANNQLANREDGERLRARGILYAPDYVVNAGGIISVALEYLGSGSEAEAQARIEKIPLTLRRILESAAASGESTSEVADRLAQQRIAAGAAKRSGR